MGVLLSNIDHTEQTWARQTVKKEAKWIYDEATFRRCHRRNQVLTYLLKPASSRAQGPSHSTLNLSPALLQL